MLVVGVDVLVDEILVVGFVVVADVRLVKKLVEADETLVVEATVAFLLELVVADEVRVIFVAFLVELKVDVETLDASNFKLVEFHILIFVSKLPLAK